MALERRHVEPRKLQMAPAAILVVFVCACLVACGCARHVPLTELGSSGAVVWVRLTTTDDERVVGEVV